MLSVNAHINLDLGIAKVQVAGGQDLKLIHYDFNSINLILSSLTYQVISEIGRISPLLSLLGLHDTNNNSMLIQFSLGNARDGAWCFAEELAGKSKTDYDDCISLRDQQIYKLGSGLLQGNFLLKITFALIYLFEWKRPSKIIKVLAVDEKKFFTID